MRNKTSSFQKTYIAMLQFVELPLQRIQKLHLLDRAMKIDSGINNSISDKLEYSDVFSQM